MQTSELVQLLKNSLQSGMFQEEDLTVFVPNPVFRILNCCSIFERHFYKNLGKISPTQFSLFYNTIYDFTVSIPISKFQENVLELSPEQRDVVLRGLGKVQEQGNSDALVEYIKVLVEGLSEL